MAIKITNSRGQKLTLSEMKRKVKEDTLKDTVPQSELLTGKVFTKTQLQKLIDQGALHPVIFKDKFYFNKNEIVSCLNSQGLNIKQADEPMKTEPQEQAKPPFKIAIIDLIDANHYADFFDDERYAWLGYQGYAEYVDYDAVVGIADRLFWALNPKAKTQEDWAEWDAGYDVRIYDANSNCVYKANEVLPTAKVKQRADEEIKKIVDEVMWSEKMTGKNS